MRLWISVLVCATAIAAGPVEFGQAEFQAALAARNLKMKVNTELSLDPPEAFRILPFTAGGARITGGDLRGLMYALIEAAEQIRSTGRLKPAHGTPAARVRGVRLVLNSSDLEQTWFNSDAFWRGYFATLARARVNRFCLTVPSLREAGSWLRTLPPLATDYGIDFTVGLAEPSGDAEALRTSLARLLSASPLIRGVELDAGGNAPVELYRDGVFRAVKDAGRRVTLDLHGAAEHAEVGKAALDAGIPLRVSAEAACDGTFCAGGPGYEFYRELRNEPNLENEDAVRRLLPALSVEGVAGFEIDVPATHTGGTPNHWEYEDHAASYMWWGRIGYDPKYQVPIPTARK